MDIIGNQEALAKEFGDQIVRFNERCQTYLGGLFNPCEEEEEEEEDIGDVEETLSKLE